MSITDKEAALWHANLKALKGFYQSSVLVSAESREAAMSKALIAIRTWNEKRVEDDYYSPVVSAFPDDEGYAQEVEAWMEEVRSELEEKLLEVKGGALVIQSI
ncbi:hypothetical protein [Sulfitobacter sp. R18_1]|uniref:hypothetical protein n=1 Tax=Sulfitobacter sp. R18_1 TaxID=2821104 RepID=UPI001ADC606B|nr:hypothetical protein [Sulfitobacter sp. R18_1]MBO9428309.1 hypothetical protein [Sulfitobacter sp. R18_1]